MHSYRKMSDNKNISKILSGRKGRFGQVVRTLAIRMHLTLKTFVGEQQIR
jgi:hypothetical protein